MNFEFRIRINFMNNYYIEQIADRLIKYKIHSRYTYLFVIIMLY